MRWAVLLRSVVLLIAVASQQGHLCKARRASVFPTFGDNWEALIHIIVFSAMSWPGSRPYDGCAFAASTVKLGSRMRNLLNLKGFFISSNGFHRIVCGGRIISTQWITHMKILPHRRSRISSSKPETPRDRKRSSENEEEIAKNRKHNTQHSPHNKFKVFKDSLGKFPLNTPQTRG